MQSLSPALWPFAAPVQFRREVLALGHDCLHSLEPNAHLCEYSTNLLKLYRAPSSAYRSLFARPPCILRKSLSVDGLKVLASPCIPKLLVPTVCGCPRALKWLKTIAGVMESPTIRSS